MDTFAHSKTKDLCGTIVVNSVVVGIPPREERAEAEFDSSFGKKLARCVEKCQPVGRRSMQQKKVDSWLFRIRVMFCKLPAFDEVDVANKLAIEQIQMTIVPDQVIRDPKD